jgi:hypothetical protein
LFDRRQACSGIVVNEGPRLISTLQSVDIILPTTDGREIRLRRITEPSPEQKSLLTSSASVFQSVLISITNVV